MRTKTNAKTAVDKADRSEKLFNTCKVHNKPEKKGKGNKKLTKLTDWDWTVLVAAWRYYEYRGTIASATFPADIMGRFYSGKYDPEEEMRIAHQFANIDHGLRGASDWDKCDECDRLEWQKFYHFCKAYANGGFVEIKTTDGGTHKCFRDETRERWIPVEIYTKYPHRNMWLADEAIVKVCDELYDTERRMCDSSQP